MRLMWLADVLRSAGLDVVEHGDWHKRGRDLQSVEAVVIHHTVTKPSASDANVVKLLINGRADLPGPLCHLGLSRDGTFHVIASGKANHNGLGRFGNQTIGIEAFNDGHGEPWLAAQMDAYHRGCAAICRHLNWPVEKVYAHKETDALRKPYDPRFDMNTFRGHVAALLKPPPQEDDDMQFRAIRRVEDGAVALVAAGYFKHVSGGELNAAIAAGLTQQPNDEVNAAEWDIVKALVAG